VDGDGTAWIVDEEVELEGFDEEGYDCACDEADEDRDEG
jgi:hypothetical protein